MLWELKLNVMLVVPAMEKDTRKSAGIMKGAKNNRQKVSGASLLVL